MTDGLDALASRWQPDLIRGRVPSVPDGVRVYAIGDVHGYARLLDGLLRQIDADKARRPVADSVEIFIGDLIDRGPDSAGVLSRVAERSNAILVRGNHEDYMTASLQMGEVTAGWLQYGGRETLASYGIIVPGYPSPDDRQAACLDLADRLPEAHVALLDGMRDHVRIGDFLFVHAGLRPGVPLERQSRDDMVLIRQPFLDSYASFGAVVVHGHTPGPEPVLRANRIGIDTGVYVNGRLTCAVLEGTTLRFLQAADV